MAKTIVECPECGKRLSVPETATASSARCPGCSAKIALPVAAVAAARVAQPRSPEASAAAESTTERAHDAGRKPARPPALWLAFTLLLVLSVVAVPMALISSLGVELSQDWPLPSMGLLGVALMAPVGVGLLAASIGLVMLRAWSRMLGIACLLCGVVYYAKLVVPVYTSLNWEHRDASNIATVVGIFQGVPLLLFVIALASLFAPALRRALANTRPSSRARAKRNA